MQEHCRAEHRWANDWQKGGNVRKKATAVRDLPWTTGVPCQRFFLTRAASGWFEVGRGLGVAVQSEPSGPGTDDTAWFVALHENQEKRFEADAREEVSIVDEKLEPNGWLYRVGWTRDLEGLNKTQLQEATRPIEDGEETFRFVWAVFNSVADKARATAAPHKVGHDVLFEAERKEISQKPVRPFDNRMEDDTWQRYKEVWRKMVSILFRMDEWPERERPPYRFTMRQGSLWDAFTSRVEADVGSREAAQAEEVERMCLDAIIAIIEDPYKQSQKESAMIGALAVLGIREDGGWHQATEYTTNYSAVIKVAKMFVVYQAWLERQDEVAELTATKGAEAAYEEASSVFHLVRDKVRRFMTRMPGRPDDEPRVMNWIYDARTYGMHIRFNTVAPGMVDWSGDRISFRRVQVRVCELAEMFHGLAQEARSLLAQLAVVDGHGDRDNEHGDEHGDGYGGRSALAAALPAIRWDSMHDDHSQDRPGYSFLHDDRNEAWVGKGKGWIARRIAESEARRRAWLDPTRGTAAAAAAAAAGEAEEATSNHSNSHHPYRERTEEATSNRSNSHHPYRERTVQAYRQALESFRERLWMLMHMVAGQPARAPELAGIRHSNTANGGVRNVFAHDSMICFVTSYHKNYRQTGTAKVIHRYLPREVGELLVWYLWLVLPFWQQVGGIIHQTDRKSAFLWADDVVVRGRAAGEASRDNTRGDERRNNTKDNDARDNTEDDDARDNTEDDDARDNTITDDARDNTITDDARDNTITDDARDNTITDESANATPGRAPWTDERLWTSDKARRIMQQHSERLVGSKINISGWRHMAVAIANRYLNEAFGRADDKTNDNDDDDVGVEDSALDLQAGHGTHVAGMIYGRLYQEAPFGTAALRDRFRAVSRQWHRLLGFGAEDRGGGAPSKRRRTAADEEFEGQRRRRFTRLQLANAAGQLRQMMGDPQAAFRGQQERVIRSIMRGDDPIVQVTGTGGGKSLSFMLPAYCAPDGVTIVVTPLVALRTDMDARCSRSGLASTTWRGGGRANTAAATVVFVTPESAVTQGFRDFVGRLQRRQQLDRVVLDECHVVLDGSRGFRPALRALGRTVQEFGAQLVCLTATLPPAEEREFFAVTGIRPERVRVFREATTRRNIGYGVVVVASGSGGRGRGRGRGAASRSRRAKSGLGLWSGREGEDGELSAVEERGCQEVRDWLRQQPRGKAVVYSSTIEGVERMAEALGCAAFHSSIGSTEDKASRLEAWRRGDGADGGVIVATNALGLGIDVPDVRLVVHAGMPRRLRDFVQESGRAGRDGQPSRSVVICSRAAVEEEEKEKEAGEAAKDGRAAGGGWEVSTRIYIRGEGWCQRWEPLGEDGGRFREVEGGSCQYQGLMVAMFAVATIGVGSRVYEETVRAMRRADGLEEWASSEKEVYEWLGQMIQWGGVQSSKLCRLTSQLWQRAVEGVADG
ncbi:Bloom syndrome protein-like protein [Colletotrichum fructicola Nara gc5]|uniref:DNA 3'-5' helicase n=1 Tax=Colletotrichum fructicola (strain Nara gc5) TaxID=1213859 RepID=A0A7J6JD47_COLFN|nr:Bloom syndrome protein-like protein [Colletotrichum fructicola Nara gc5]KAF4488101.1 Bloom syndrome protein-like protein [Colletotrichum fructicola Nara gc5]